ncbi:unnamed protein product [Sphagnum balticum]
MPTQKTIFPRALLDPPLRPTLTESFEIRRHTEDGRSADAVSDIYWKQPEEKKTRKRTFSTSVEMLDGRASRTTTLMSFACASPLSDPIANTLQRQQERKSTGQQCVPRRRRRESGKGRSS